MNVPASFVVCSRNLMRSWSYSIFMVSLRNSSRRDDYLARLSAAQPAQESSRWRRHLAARSSEIGLLPPLLGLFRLVGIVGLLLRLAGKVARNGLG